MATLENYRLVLKKFVANLQNLDKIRLPGNLKMVIYQELSHLIITVKKVIFRTAQRHVGEYVKLAEDIKRAQRVCRRVTPTK